MNCFHSGGVVVGFGTDTDEFSALLVFQLIRDATVSTTTSGRQAMRSDGNPRSIPAPIARCWASGSFVMGLETHRRFEASNRHANPTRCTLALDGHRGHRRELRLAALQGIIR